MQSYIWIAIGSALGGMARHWCGVTGVRLLGDSFPWPTLFVNILGSFIIGLFATLTGPDGRFLAGTTAREFIMVGLLGGYTTFSAFSLQTLGLMQDERWAAAGLYIAGSLVLCLLAVWAGHVGAMSFNALKGS
jgi:fluoride exporter